MVARGAVLKSGINIATQCQSACFWTYVNRGLPQEIEKGFEVIV